MKKTEVKIVPDKTRGIIRLIGSGIFLFFAFIKIFGQPFEEMLYTSRVTVALYLFISLVLAFSSFYLYIKNKIIYKDYHEKQPK